MRIHHPLDNPVWHALISFHSGLGLGDLQARRYRPEILPFAGFENPSDPAWSALNGLLKENDNFFIFGELRGYPTTWTLLIKLDCLQMILEKPDALINNKVDVEKLNDFHKDQIFNLVDQVQPGYFRKESIQLGHYFGILMNGKLISVGGERMRLPGFTEISAICTDPAFTGLGNAQRIISHICQQNLKAGNVPFLHVLKTNTRAIRLYEMLGFRQRKMMDIWHFEFTSANNFLK